MTILPNGDVYACRRFESKVGNVFEEPLYDIFITKEEIYRDYDKFEKCSKCELRGILPGLSGCSLRNKRKLLRSRSAMLERNRIKGFENDKCSDREYNDKKNNPPLPG